MNSDFFQEINRYKDLVVQRRKAIESSDLNLEKKLLEERRALSAESLESNEGWRSILKDQLLSDSNEFVRLAAASDLLADPETSQLGRKSLKELADTSNSDAGVEALLILKILEKKSNG